MKINAFFANRLNAPLYNHVWSWGAVDSTMARVFLRTDDELVYDENGDWVIAYNPQWNASNGHKERLRHIDMMRSGHEGFAVQVSFNAKGKIESFNDHTLLQLGRIVEEEGLIYVEVVAEVDVDDVISGSRTREMFDDLVALAGISRDETSRLAKVKARIGQGEFRSAVLREWDYQCSVTGVSTTQAIRASHIQPWSASTNEDRLDSQNGLPLIATLDALFDAGLISFSDDGKLLISAAMNEDDTSTLQLAGMALSRSVSQRTKQYLHHHREHVFRR